ncbi:MAG: hypothetical protein ACOYM3_09555 [Terrimicrobiaceae bacterium]
MYSAASLAASHSTAKGAEPVKPRKNGTAQFSFQDDSWSSSAIPRTDPPSSGTNAQYLWKEAIVTTTFWIGERPTENNPVPNHKSCWDTRWAANYGGTDSPKRSDRLSTFIPRDFTPRQNPFYVALPYNDMTSKGHKPEASQIIPWFQNEFQSPTRSVCKGRWIAIRRGNRVCYAQWEDAGPFRTDHAGYVFGNERPKPNLNKGAGLDVSPAVRDFLGMDDTDLTDWKFVEFADVPTGPWATFGDNNTFVINRRAAEEKAQIALAAKSTSRQDALVQ